MSDASLEEVTKPTSDKSTPSEPGDTPPQSPHSPSSSPVATNTDAGGPSEALGDSDEATQRQQTRSANGGEFFGQVHPPPRPGHPDRRHLFVQSTPIPDNKKVDIVEKWKASMVGDGTSEPSPMGDHLRPSTPPTERVQKTREQLEEMGIEVNDEIYKTIFDQFTGNSGLYTSLQEYAADGKDIPVEHARELVRQIDRLKMEFATQTTRQHLINKALKEEFDEFKRSCEQEKADLEARNNQLRLKNGVLEKDLEGYHAEIDAKEEHFKDTTSQLKIQVRTLKEQINQLKSEKEVPDEKPARQVSSESELSFIAMKDCG